MRLAVPLLIAVLALPCAAFAGKAEEERYADYMARSDEFRNASNALDAAWKAMKAACPADEFKAVQKRQRAWLKERNAKMMGGLSPSGAARMVEARTREIEAAGAACSRGSSSAGAAPKEDPSARRAPSPAEARYGELLASSVVYRKAEFDLGVAWEELKAVCAPDELEAERDGQRAWLKDRDARILGGEDAASLAKMAEARARLLSDRASRLGQERRDGCLDAWCGRTRLPEDLEGAEELERAAERGDAAAQFDLGRLYLNGCPGVAADAGKAEAWLAKAADGGNAGAKYLLGSRLAHNGCNDDPARYGEGLRLLEEAADAGVRCAPVALAEAYRTGGDQYLSPDPLGEPDEEKALLWYRKAAEFPFDRRSVLYELSCLEKDPEANLAYTRRAAEIGVASDMFSLSDGYAEGKGTKRDPFRAGEWRERAYFALMQDDGMAFIPHCGPFSPMEVAAYWLDTGRDRKRAAQWYDYAYSLLRSGRVRDLGMAVELADVYFDGKKTDRDLGKALTLYEMGAEPALREGSIVEAARALGESGNAVAAATFRAGYICTFGANPRLHDYDRGRACFELLADTDSGANMNLAVIWENGIGVPKDLRRAGAHYRAACDQGDRKACDRLR